MTQPADRAEQRPLIGIPTQHFHVPPGKHIHGVRNTYVQALHLAGAAPILIPLALHPATYHRIFQQLDGVFLPGGPDILPASYGENAHALLGRTDSGRDEL